MLRKYHGKLSFLDKSTLHNSTASRTPTADVPSAAQNTDPILVEDPAGLDTYSYSALPEMRSVTPLEFSSQELQFPNGSKQKQCSLKTHSLNDCTAYSSLSYTWGPPINTLRCREEYSIPRDWILSSSD